MTQKQKRLVILKDTRGSYYLNVKLPTSEYKPRSKKKEKKG